MSSGIVSAQMHCCGAAKLNTKQSAAARKPMVSKKSSSSIKFVVKARSSSSLTTSSSSIDINNNKKEDKEEEKGERESDALSKTLKKAFVTATASLVLAVAGVPQEPVAAAPLDVTNKISINGPARYLPSELTKPDPIFEEDFNVSFAGLKVDHKILVSTIILGQAIGFAGAIAGGLEAKKESAGDHAIEQVAFGSEREN